LAVCLNLVDFACHPALAQEDEQSKWVQAVSLKVTDLLMQEFTRGCSHNSYNGASLRAFNDFKQMIPTSDVNQLAKIISSKDHAFQPPAFAKLENMLSLSAGLFCSSAYQMPNKLSNMVRLKQAKVFEWKWRSGMPLDTLNGLGYEDTWLILGAGGDETALFHPQNKKYIAKFGLASKAFEEQNTCPGRRFKGRHISMNLKKNDQAYQGSLLVDIDIHTVSTPAVSLSVCSRLLHAGCNQDDHQNPCVAWIDDGAYVRTVASSLPQITCQGGIALILYNPSTAVKRQRSGIQTGMWLYPEAFDAVTDVIDAGGETWKVARKSVRRRDGTGCEGFIAVFSSKLLSKKLPSPPAETTGDTGVHTPWSGEWTTGEKCHDPHAFIVRIGWSSSVVAANTDGQYEFENFEAFSFSVAQSSTTYSVKSTPQCALAYDNHTFSMEWGKAGNLDGVECLDSSFPYMKPENVGQAP
jgi:hypothetical protein